jgi:hypothetical protein
VLLGTPLRAYFNSTGTPDSITLLLNQAQTEITSSFSLSTTSNNLLVLTREANSPSDIATPFEYDMAYPVTLKSSIPIRPIESRYLFFTVMDLSMNRTNQLLIYFPQSTSGLSNWIIVIIVISVSLVALSVGFVVTYYMKARSAGVAAEEGV